MKRFSKLLAIVLALTTLFAILALPANAETKTVEIPNTVYMAVEGYGVVTIELYPEEAPITVANFKSLVSEGFYDGLTFHRIIESFMIQGGDPKGNGTGGNTDKEGNEINITGEFSKNLIGNNIKHIEGTISMARSGHPYEAYHNAGYYNIPYSEREPYYNSASSQFFIVTETSANNSESLDGNYAAFGRVTDGMNIVKKIAGVKTDENDRPTETVKIATITFNKSEAEAAVGTVKGKSQATIVAIIVTVSIVGALVLAAAIIIPTVIIYAKKKAAEKEASRRKNRRKKK